MRLDRIVATASALLAWAGVAIAADERPRDCKNHYILEPPCLVSGEPTATARIAKLYSTRDAQVQYVELQVVRVAGAPLVLAGRSMTVTDRRGHARSFDMGKSVTTSAPLAQADIIVASTVNDAWGPYSDLLMPGAFLPIDGGTIVIDGMDGFEYGPLPDDGASALARDGSIVPAIFGRWGQTQVYDTMLSEFYNAALDHYFMTDRADEIDALVGGATPGWQPTGKSIYLFSRRFADGLGPVCRYLLRRPGSYSHFFSRFVEECDELAGGADNVLEATAAFQAGAPVDGHCGTVTMNYATSSWTVPLVPVYRLWNGRADANHRYVTSLAERDAMIARGWRPEGSGESGIGMCGTAEGWTAYCIRGWNCIIQD